MTNLLKDRFKLVTHQETRELPVYNLVLARSDRRLGPGAQGDLGGVPGGGEGVLRGRPPRGARAGAADGSRAVRIVAAWHRHRSV